MHMCIFSNSEGYPRHARIKETYLDSAGTSRYYQCEYKLSQKKFASVKRTAQSLVLIYKNNEQKEDGERYLDFIDCISEEDLQHEQKKKKVMVKTPRNTDMISDI